MLTKNIKAISITCALFASFALTGCVTTSSYDSSQTPGLSDPFEEINRKTFAFNNVVDRNIINPVIDGYRYAVPIEIRTGLDNALNNLQSPAHFANQLLQGDVKGAGKVLFSTVVNTFVGFGGLIDVAKHEGYTSEKEDFGQTLAVWGVDHGPYVVLPFMGSSSARDGLGYLVDAYADPIYWYSKNVDRTYLRYNKHAVNYLNTRDKLKDVLTELERSSVDYYASIRSTYYQARKKQISDNAVGDALSDAEMEFPDFEDY